MKKTKSVKAFAPATVANVAVGFDILGFAIEGLGDTVEINMIPEPIVKIEKITGIEGISCDPKKNTATLGLIQLIKDKKLNFGFNVKIYKSIPLGSGLGGSAASAVAGIVAANGLLTKKLTLGEMFHYALIGEECASGSKHPDNVAPALCGGFIYTHSMEPFEFERIPMPSEIVVTCGIPHLRLDTRDARSVLSPEISLKKYIAQNSKTIGFLISAYTKNLKLMSHSLEDLLVEPQRASLIPGFKEVKAAALKAGALGCSISGAGPTVFALSEKSKAKKILKSMQYAFKKSGHLDSTGIISPISKSGAKLL